MTGADDYEKMIEEWRSEYIADRTSKKGWQILEKLVAIQKEMNQNVETTDEVENIDDFSTSKLVKLIIGDISTKDLLVDHQTTLLEFIPSAHPNILRHVVRTIREKERSIPYLTSTAIAVGIAFARRVSDSEAGEEIGRLLAYLVIHPMICDELKSQLSSANGRDGSVIRSRIYAIAAERARLTSDSSCIHWLYEEILKVVLDKKDLLAQLDALDVFVDVALSDKESAEAIFKLGIVQKIYELMEWSKESPDGGEMYLYGTRFLCYMARSYPEVINAYPDFVSRIMLEIRMFDQLSVVGRLGAFDHFASMCFSVEAKQVLVDMFKESDDLKNTLEAAGAACTMGTTEMKCRTLQAVTLLFQNSTDTLATSWYEHLGGKAMTHVAIGLIKKPFPELKNSVYDFWKKLLDYPSIVHNFVTFQGFVEWALDEKAEDVPEYEWRKRKTIISIITMSNDSNYAEIIRADPDLITRLLNYIRPAAAPAPRVEEMAL